MSQPLWVQGGVKIAKSALARIEQAGREAYARDEEACGFLEGPDTDPLLCDGFHSFEPDNGFRWTNGDALLPPELFAGIAGPCELELRIGCTALYPSDAAEVVGVWNRERASLPPCPDANASDRFLL